MFDLSQIPWQQVLAKAEPLVWGGLIYVGKKVIDESVPIIRAKVVKRFETGNHPAAPILGPDGRPLGRGSNAP